MNVKCMAVDDSQTALSNLERYISKIPWLEVIGIYNNSIKAHEEILKLHPQLLFVDMQMPGLSGKSLIEKINQNPDLPTLIIITSSFTRYAKDGFDLKVVDFLKKPYTFSRFREAADFARLRIYNNQEYTINRSKIEECIHLKIPERGLVEEIRVADIIYISVEGNITTYHLKTNKFSIGSSLAKALTDLPGNHFLQVNANNAVAVHLIESYIKRKITLITKHQFEVSRYYKPFVDKILYKK
jgi:two-component system, LytTR family, response regulator